MKALSVQFIICSILLLCFYNTHAQKQNNVWCFGDSAVVDFNSGIPVSTRNCILNQLEGCASISDRNTGQLLFYTDGVHVFDSNNDTMPGQVGNLGGNWTTTQSALIVPMPGSISKYYIFCTDAQAGYLEDGGDGGTQYCIIDMNLRGGLGDMAKQATPLLRPTCEKISAITMSNNHGYWIIVHQWNSDAFYTYPLTAVGIGAPVISHTGIAVPLKNPSDFGIEAAGYMRISPDGKKIAVANDEVIHSLQVFNFNDTTANISGPIVTEIALYVNDGIVIEGPYGVCFSPNSELLYFTVGEDSNIYQVNLIAGDSNAILASQIVIGTSTTIPKAIQIGPDQKIYIADYESGYLDCINFPNRTGPACDYKSNAVTLYQATCQLGLPEFPVSYLPECKTALVISLTSNGDTLRGFDAALYQWYLNGYVIPGATDSIFIAKQAGSYTLLITDTLGCTGISNPIVITGIEHLTEQSISLFPNPTNDKWQLSIDDKLLGSKLEIFDNNGRVVYQSQLADLKTELNINVSPGIYLLRISSGSNSFIKKLIKL